MCAFQHPLLGFSLVYSERLILLRSHSPPTPEGHLGDVTVEHVAHHLPIIVREFLTKAEETNGGVHTAESISELFGKAIMAFDDAIAHDVLDLFGGSVDKLDDYTDAQIREVINDQHKGGVNWRKARLCMYGTTALAALVDPEHNNLWIANIGDCQACKYPNYHPTICQHRPLPLACVTVMKRCCYNFKLFADILNPLLFSHGVADQ